MIQNEQNMAISRHFKKPAEYTRAMSGTIFSTDVLTSGGQVIFQYKTWCIPLEAKTFYNGSNVVNRKHRFTVWDCSIFSH